MEARFTTMKYFPLTADDFAHTFGVRAIGRDEKLIETTEHYRSEISIKRDLLIHTLEEYAAFAPDVLDAQREAVKYLVPHCDHLRKGRNDLLNESLDLSINPLLSLAMHLQEDLVVLENNPAANYPIIAGVVCFPSGWSLPEKLGQGIVHVHAPVHDFESALAAPTQNLLTHLKMNRPVWRMNWGVRPSSQLDQSSRHADYLSQQQSLIDADNAGEQCFLRVERQTLSRLPETGNILFTIHTHQSSLSELADEQKQRLMKTLQTCPSETLRYKGLSSISTPVIAYLRNR